MTPVEDIATEARRVKALGHQHMLLKVQRARGWRPRGTHTRIRGLGEAKIIGPVDGDATRWLVEIGVDQVLDAVDPSSNARDRRRKRGRAA